MTTDRSPDIEYSRRQRILTDCLLGKADIEAMIDQASQLMGCPIILTTNYYRVISMVDLGRQIEDPIWLYAAQTGYCSPDAVAAFEREGITREVLESRSAILLDRGLGEQIPRILQKIDVFGKPGAYIGVFQGGKSFDEVDFLTTDLLCQILSLMLERSSNVHEFGIQVQQSILLDLLSGVLNSAPILGDRLKVADWDPKPMFQCVLLTSESSASQIDNLDYLCLSLLRTFSSAKVLPVERGLMLLLNFDADHSGSADESALLDFATHYHLRIFLSGRFPHLIHLRAYYEACLKMDLLPKHQRGEGRLIHFEEVLFPVLGQILTPNERRAFTQTHYRQLLDYDRQNNTEYCKTLRTFITCGCSATLTAKALYVHRNTLTKRLSKIKEISDIDIENGDELVHFYLSDQLHGTII